MFQNGIIKRPHYLKIIGICGLFIIIDEDTSDGVFVYIYLLCLSIYLPIFMAKIVIKY